MHKMMFALLLVVACLINQGCAQYRSFTDCEIQRQGPSPEWAKPKCNPDGSYKIYQCDPYSRTVCWCVYPNGQMIPGTSRKVNDPEQEKRDLADCEKARKIAPNAPPAASAPSAQLDPRLGYNLATAQIPDVPAQAGSPSSMPMQPCPADCPAPCPLNCVPTPQPSMIHIQMPPSFFTMAPAPPAAMPLPQLPPRAMPAPQPMPCPQPCLGSSCPPGCPQTPAAMPPMPPMPPMPQYQQQQQVQCPQFCSTNCPPGCPAAQQQQPAIAPPPQPQPQPQLPSYQMQIAQPPPVQLPQAPQQICPQPCTSSCPPGCAQQSMDPMTGMVQQQQQQQQQQQPQQLMDPTTGMVQQQQQYHQQQQQQTQNSQYQPHGLGQAKSSNYRQKNKSYFLKNRSKFGVPYKNFKKNDYTPYKNFRKNDYTPYKNFRKNDYTPYKNFRKNDYTPYKNFRKNAYKPRSRKPAVKNADARGYLPQNMFMNRNAQMNYWKYW